MNNSNIEAATPSSNQQSSHQQDAFKFTIIKPFSNPNAPKATFLIEGLLTQGGLAALVAKPKHSKSSISRYAAVCVAKGKPFLGRETQRGEVLLITVEDPIQHVENCLKVLDWNPECDEAILMISAASSGTESNINALREVLTNHPGIRFVVIDTFAKFGRVRDMNEYTPWLKVFDGLKQLRTDFPQVSILCVLHAKKTTGDDFFDSMLGSSALRGEFDSNLAIYAESGKRLITAECRMGRPLAPTILDAVVVTSEGCDVVKDFSLGDDFSKWSSDQKSRAETKRKASMEERIIAYLSAQPDERAEYKFVLENVEGKAAKKIEAAANLIKDGVLKESGVKGSPTDPYTVTLDRDALQMHDFQNRFGGGGEAN
jgi:hypothetical protein